MTLLAFSTSTDHGGVALLSGNKINSLNWTRGQSSEVLNLKIRTLLKSAHKTLNQIELLAVDIGPGSFTGCRVSVNVAKSLSYALKIPIVAATSLDIMGFEVAKNTAPPFLCVLDAHKSLFYSKLFTKNSAATITTKTQVELEDLIKEGIPSYGYLPEHPTLISKSITPNAKALAKLASQLDKSRYVAWQALEPKYIRDPDAVAVVLR